MNAFKLTPLAALIAAVLVAGCGDNRDTAGTDRSSATGPSSTATRNDRTSSSTGGATESSGAAKSADGTTSAGAATSPGAATTTPSGTTAGSAESSGTATAAGGSPAAGGTGGSMSGSAAGTTSSGAPSDSAANAGARAGGATAAGGSAGATRDLALVDRNFVTTAAVDGMYEVEVAKVAAQKATDPAVKAFASMLVEHHTQVNNELKQLAGSRNVQLPTELPSNKKEELKKLQQASGAAFDRQFVQEVGIKDHQDDIRAFEKASVDAKDPELKAWAGKTLPQLREHLAQARTLPGGGSREKTTGLAAPTDGGTATGGSAATSGGAATTATTPPPPALGR